ncbi:hypothetical protein [Niveispirillum cyanobacteriorum]|uniref:Uncharacterized protein n=1 Tax=Niveispirillum cyanobacteriorum TaxID=1612173 RepID=A0A2K9ND63_9PROT|nr:hypothetical protein [Niveispirillum cyanobacteriorum]AUN30932.1 hypothetical protein C0V82_12280 [Niveispirillum cyanobacteriorum]GGE80887.1 hypothetical protein GCM10011317_42610 [Niveispirillum cyanobacteriorum]
MSMPSSDTTDARKPVETGATGAPLTGEVQDSVDPFDYAETIVRDLAHHVGSRLRDFRSDLAAMHSAVVQLPETMKINALGQSIQELRERLAHLTGVVSQQVTRYPEELDRVAKSASELLNRVAGLESWIAAARQTMAQGGEGPNLPMPTGGFVGHDQFEAIISQVHDSILRVVGAVRDLQLDVRDIRSDIRKGAQGDVAAAAAPVAAAPATPDHGPALAELSRRLAALENRPTPASGQALADLERRLKALEDQPAAEAPAPAAPAVPPAPVAAAPAQADVAALVFGAWHRLSLPAGDKALSQTVEAVLSTLSRTFDQTVRSPQVAKGSGIVAVATATRAGTPITALLATEDLCGRTWTLGADAADMAAPADGDKPAAARTPCWRALLAASALVEQQQPGTKVLPLLVYGHGSIDKLPTRDDMNAHAGKLGVSAAAERLLVIGAPDQSGHTGFAQPRDLLSALTELGL